MLQCAGSSLRSLYMRVPHACGDGPRVKSWDGRVRACSPRLWGWTIDEKDLQGLEVRTEDGSYGATAAVSRALTLHGRYNGASIAEEEEP